MQRIVGLGRVTGALAGLCALLLGGCSSLGGLSPSSGVAGGGPALLSADIGKALFALDLPVTVAPISPGPRLVVAVPGGGGLEAVLVRADAEPVMAALPPPGEGRSYFVYALSPADRAALATLQGRLAGATATVTVVPALCVAAGADRARERVSVLPVLGGRPLRPLIAGETLAGIAARTGTPMPPCAGQ